MQDELSFLVNTLWENYVYFNIAKWKNIIMNKECKSFFRTGNSKEWEKYWVT